MSKLGVRLIFGALLALALCGGAFAAPARPAAAAATWQVHVGGGTQDGAVEAMTYLPASITINAGDTVSWVFAGFHTVTFLSGGQPPQLVIGGAAGPELNPTVAFPSGGSSYAGTGFVNSGALPAGPDADKFALTFTTPGTYQYLCLLHPGMAGSVVVQAAGSAYPATQDQVSAQGNAEFYAALSKGNELIQSAQVTTKPGASGATNYSVINGIGSGTTSVIRFLPVELTVNAGDSVTWTVDDTHEIHTVTFYDPAGPQPIFTETQPQPNGPPKILLRNVAPSGGTTVDKVGEYSSGVMAPGQSYTLTFTKPGTYSYLCLIHADLGQTGKIVVKAAGAGGAPARLPTTAEPAGLPAAWLAAGALLLALLGALMLRAARARAR